MRSLRWIILGLSLSIVLGGLPAPTSLTPVSASSAGGISTPVLKWQDSCNPWCDTGWYASPAVADLDKDGKPEVIWGSYDAVALNGENGTEQWRDPNSGNNNRVWPGVVVADLTGNGSLEVVVGRGGDEVTVYNSAGGVLWTRNPFGGGEVRTLAVADLENDGQYEIIVGRASGGSTRQLNVYDANGNVRPGWPARRDGEDGYGWGMYNENVAVADLNGDGLKEIIGPTDTHYITALDRNGNQLLANAAVYPNSDHNDNGLITWAEVGVHVDQAADVRGYANCGTEHRPNFANVGPAIADVNGDGVREIIVPGDVYNCALGDPDGDMYYLPWILKLDRTRWSGSGYDWTVLPNPSANSGPLTQDYNVIEYAVTNAVIADLDNDGQQEILYSSYDGKIHAYWLDKTEHSSWPFEVYTGGPYRFASEPVVADLDGDGPAEVIFTTWTQKGSNQRGQLIIASSTGVQLQAVTLPASSSTWDGALGAPTLANIDADADLEVVLGTAHTGVVAYDLPNTANARILWGTGRGTYLRAGTPPACIPGLPIAGGPAPTPFPNIVYLPVIARRC